MSRILMHEKVICDICGKDITDEIRSKNKYPYEIVKVCRRRRILGPLASETVDRYDICEKCWNRIKEEINKSEDLNFEKN